jgi:hypothetical protein
LGREGEEEEGLEVEVEVMPFRMTS